MEGLDECILVMLYALGTRLNIIVGTRFQYRLRHVGSVVANITELA